MILAVKLWELCQDAMKRHLRGLTVRLTSWCYVLAYVRKRSLGQLPEFTAGQCTGAGTGGPRARKDTTVGSGRCKQE